MDAAALKETDDGERRSRSSSIVFWCARCDGRTEVRLGDVIPNHCRWCGRYWIQECPVQEETL
jgi:hypothetical protein